MICAEWLLSENPAAFCMTEGLGTLGFQTQEPVGLEVGSERDVDKDQEE